MSHWDDKAIEKTARILVEAQKRKKTGIRVLDEAVHWLLLLVALLGNGVIALFLVLSAPLVGKLLLPLAAVLGLGFGWLVDIPLRDIEKLDVHKHFLSRILLPLIAVLNIFLFQGITRTVEALGAVDLALEPTLMGSVYAAGFLLPHFLHFRTVEGR